MDAVLHINQDGVTSGPYTLAEVREGVDSGRFSLHDLAWYNGASNWLPLDEILAYLDTSSEATEFASSSIESATEFAGSTDSAATEFVSNSVEGATEFVASPDSDITEFSPSESNPSPLISRRRFVAGDLIVRGQYRILSEIHSDGKEALTYKGESVIDNSLVFIKQLVEARRTRTEREKLAELRDRLMSIDNDYCLSYRDLEFGENHIVQVFEYLADYTDLRSLIRSDPAALRPETDRFVRQLAEGVNYLHNLGIVHRDLKPGNVMARRFPEGWKIKIVDYGTVSLVEDDRDGAHTTFAGTPHYAPPESQGRKFQEKTPILKKYDWWGVGRIIQEVLSGSTVADLVGGDRFQVGSISLEAHFEALLREEKVEHYGCRAGLVELTEARIPGGLGKYRSLLRGLLTSSLEERWGFAEIARWLKQPDTPPPDAYDKPPDRQSNHRFPYQGKSYTLGEIAQTLATAEHWDNAQKFLFQGLNADPNAKSLLDFIRNDLGDKRLLRDLDEITSLPNPRKLENRYLLPALEDYATALALSRMAKDSSKPLALHLRGIPLNRAILFKWSRSTISDEQNRVAVLTHGPLIEVITQIDAPFHAELLPVLSILKQVLKIEQAVNGEPLSPQALARLFSLILTPSDDLQPLLATVRKRYRKSSIELLNPLLTGTEKSPEPATLVYLIYSAETDPTSYNTHEEFLVQERAEFFLQADVLRKNYAWLTVAQIRNSRHPLYLDNTQFGKLCALVVGQVTFLALFYCLAVLFLTAHRPDSAHDRRTLLPLVFPCLASYVAALLGLHGLIWGSVRNYLKAYVRGGGEDTAFDASILKNITQNGGRLKGKTRSEVAQDYHKLEARLKELPTSQSPTVKLPPLPRPLGLIPLYFFLTLLFFYCLAEPFLLVLLGGPVVAHFALVPLVLLLVATAVAWLTGVFSPRK